MPKNLSNWPILTDKRTGDMWTSKRAADTSAAVWATKGINWICPFRGMNDFTKRNPGRSSVECEENLMHEQN